MSVPKHLWRFPTAEAISSLANRFELPNAPQMQDWEWEVADSKRIDEFLDTYLCGELTDDERFTLMEMIIQSFEELDSLMTVHPRWTEFLKELRQNIDLHVYSVWYWSDLENELGEEAWQVTPYFRKILEDFRDEFENPQHQHSGVN